MEALSLRGPASSAPGALQGGEGGSLLSHTSTREETGAPSRVTSPPGRRGGLPPESHLHPGGEGGSLLSHTFVR